MWQIYIILLEVSHITDHPHPDKHGACAKEDAAHIIAGEHLGGKKHEWWTQKNTCSIKQKIITASTIEMTNLLKCYYLCLDRYLEKGTNDSQRVADDNKDIPAVHKL